MSMDQETSEIAEAVLVSKIDACLEEAEEAARKLLDEAEEAARKRQRSAAVEPPIALENQGVHVSGPHSCLIVLPAGRSGCGQTRVHVYIIFHSKTEALCCIWNFRLPKTDLQTLQVWLLYLLHTLPV